MVFQEFEDNQPGGNASNSVPAKLKFQDSFSTSLIISRLLANNVCRPFQSTLNTLKNDPYESDVDFQYNVVELGAVKDPQLKFAEVTAIAPNNEFNYLHAAGFAFGKTGGVALISLKNTLYAEKIYRLKEPVACLSFSKMSPNLLAVGTRNGVLWVFNVSDDNFMPMYMVPALIYGAVSVVHWWKNVIIWNNGNRVMRLERPFLTTKAETIMTISYSALLENVPTAQGPKITGLFQNCEKPDEYVVSSSDGALRYCFRYNTREIQESIKNAHIEVISGIRPVPYCAKMFLTFGCDGTVKLWAWAIKEALIVFQTDEAPVDLQDACWSPLHATIVASCSPNKIFIWDLRRRTHAPISITETRYTCLNIQFSACGEFLLVGTGDGRIVYFGLGQMPFPEKLKVIAFRTAIFRKLAKEDRQHLLKNFSCD